MASSDRPGERRLTEEDRRELAAAAAAVGGWADFPFDAVPRPVVLTGGAVQVERGFATGEAKYAFLQGAIEADETVPAEPVLALRREPQLTAAPARSRLRVTGAVVDQTAFATDRGPLMLPAWKVEAVDTLGPIWVLTEQARQRCWNPPPPLPAGRGAHSLDHATVDADGTTLTVFFTGSSPKHFGYRAEVIETAAALTVVPLGHLLPGQTLTGPVAAIGHPRKAEVRLASPLDGRVLVNPNATPVPVVS
jgi:hypothetical protein